MSSTSPLEKMLHCPTKPDTSIQVKQEKENARQNTKTRGNASPRNAGTG